MTFSIYKKTGVFLLIFFISFSLVFAQNILNIGLEKPLPSINTDKETSFEYESFLQMINSKNEKKPKPVKGLSGIYSLKRLSEVI